VNVDDGQPLSPIEREVIAVLRAHGTWLAFDLLVGAVRGRRPKARLRGMRRAVAQLVADGILEQTDAASLGRDCGHDHPGRASEIVYRWSPDVMIVGA
jgi:hypothetical protein